MDIDGLELVKLCVTAEKGMEVHAAINRAVILAFREQAPVELEANQILYLIDPKQIAGATLKGGLPGGHGRA